MENEEFKYEKSVCERYDIRFGHGGWATFTIDEKGGLFNCQSDYGDYSYSWPYHGRESFKHFLVEISRNPDYLLKKVATKGYFDSDKAVNAPPLKEAGACPGGGKGN